MLNLLLFGPPGSGKGTQSQKIQEKYKLSHISTGELIRNEIAEETEIGRQLKKLIGEGHYASDEIALLLLEKRITELANPYGYVFDGFPRTTAQAPMLDKLLVKFGSSVTAMLSLEVPDQTLVDRLSKRAGELGRPEDQNETVIKLRMKTYQNSTAKVAYFYQENRKLHKINGIGTVHNVFERIVTVVDAF